MKKKDKFKTLKEIKEAYPINSVFEERTEKAKGYYYDDNDLRCYYSVWGKNNVIITPEENSVLITHKIYTYVKGYIFDGKYWYPAGVVQDDWYKLTHGDYDEEGENI